MPDFMNVNRPSSIPVRPGGDPRDCTVRLVEMTGEESFVNCRAVRYTPTHTMVRIAGPDTFYLWLKNEDVQLGRQC